MPVKPHAAALTLLGQSAELIGKVVDQFPFKLTRFIEDRIRAGTYSIAAARQFLPDARELQVTPFSHFDPCNENEFKATSHVIQKYNNRAALIVTQRCLVYCRFCFRRDFVGFPRYEVLPSDLQDGIRYLETHSENRDVLLTGGDPLALPNRQLIPLLMQLSAIEHVKVIRVHTRALSAEPQRLDEELLSAFAKSGKVWMYAHMNHPDDINHVAVHNAASLVRAANVPVLNQAVILGGVNDSPEVIHDLCLRCYEAKIIPYHLYVLDQVPGTSHFYVFPSRLMEIFDSLATLPGPAQPVFVVVDRENLKNRFIASSGIDRNTMMRLLETKTGCAS